MLDFSRLQLLQEGLKARSKVGRLRFQTRGVFDTGKEFSMNNLPDWDKIQEEIEILWRKEKLPDDMVWETRAFLEAWITGIAWFVAPGDQVTRNGVQDEMWHNPKVWRAASKWGIAMDEFRRAIRAEPPVPAYIPGLTQYPGY